MLIIDPSKVAVAVGAKCGGKTPDSNDEQIITILNLILPRIEDAMNVASLVRGNFTDSFYLSKPSRRQRADERERIQLRLSNGYVDPTSIVVTGSDGNAVAHEIVTVETSDAEFGIVNLSSWERGAYRVAYTSGFKPSDPPQDPPEGYDPNSRVLQNVPDWITGLAIDLVVQWWRTQNINPSVPKAASYAALDSALRRDIYVRVYGRYMRPRVGVIWSESLSRG